MRMCLRHGRPSRVFGLLIWVALCSMANKASALSPGQELSHQRIALNGGERYHALEHLAPRTTYEVKVSFYGPEPARFDVKLLPLASLPHSRRLLDVEKAIFTTDPDGLMHGEQPMALVSAQTVGHYRYGVAPPEDASYNIGGLQGNRSVTASFSLALHFFVHVCAALGEVVFGIPKEAFYLLPWLFVCVILAVSLWPRLARALVKFIDPRARWE